MPRVRTLDIWDGRLRFVRPDFFLALSRIKSVKSLMLFDCQLSNVTQLRRIVSAFPRLAHLTVQNLDFAQQDAASYAGASLFQAPSHTRLRRLEVRVEHEQMVMFLDWITRSGLCTSLADLSISTNYSTPAPTPLNRLLETTGASLTRFDEDHYGLDPCKTAFGLRTDFATDAHAQCRASRKSAAQHQLADLGFQAVSHHSR
ncbi:uncharacterized protein B0H18DRAFT_536752 [Fomitopsis serialis]|uniref:uncharacterized protein n=1 Tax=Fomitopsis serialis TaxID=139415 RepID=UPI002007D155|nr:uncharacterized protein B0H18DRAFT_536752 [Neoantrodia serialis]KAH9921759.1 hypothetical protein B0H18DRAFT_536752 [Neoantrodia serialis]